MAIASDIIQAASALPFDAFLSKLGIGRPRGDLQKFSRTIYPVMAEFSRRTGIPSYALWFGETIEVTPDGRVNVIAVSGSLQAHFQILDQIASRNQIASLECPPGIDFERKEDLARCSFILKGDQPGFFDRLEDRIFGPGPGPGGEQRTTQAGFSGLSLLLILGVGIFLLSRR